LVPKDKESWNKSGKRGLLAFKTLFSHALKPIMDSLCRSQKLAPEEDSLGACFICQDEFCIDQLPQL